MPTHIALTRKWLDWMDIPTPEVTTIVPLATSTFTEDAEGQVTCHSGASSFYVVQTMKQILTVIKPIGFYKT